MLHKMGTDITKVNPKLQIVNNRKKHKEEYIISLYLSDTFIVVWTVGGAFSFNMCSHQMFGFLKFFLVLYVSL